jgi:hypothetical protein
MKLFNFKPVIAMVYSFTGLALILLSFFVGQIGWWNVLYALAIVMYLSTADGITRRIMT